MSTSELHDERNDENDDREVEAANRLRKSAERLIVHDDGPNANLFDTAKFEQCYRIAQAMSQMSILPEHLKTTGSKNNLKFLTPKEIAANCFRIVNQAVRWGMDPYAIIDETYVVAGKLGYQGKLIAAVVNTRARGLKGRLNYEHTGAGDDMEVTVSGNLDGEVKTITLCVRDAKTQNDMWRTDPEQKLCYSGATKWARRHCPEVMLGILTDDDLDRIAESRPQKVNSLDELVRTQPREEEGAEVEEKQDEAVAGNGEISLNIRDALMDDLDNALDGIPDATKVEVVRATFLEACENNEELEHVNTQCDEALSEFVTEDTEQILTEELMECVSLTDVEACRGVFMDQVEGQPEVLEMIGKLCDARTIAIKAQRGQRSNRK